MQTAHFPSIEKPADPLKVVDAPLPDPEPGNVRIKIIANPINSSD